MLVGKLVGYLGLKHVFREDFDQHASYKTVQRYFAGKRIQPEVVQAVLTKIVECCIPHDVALPANEMGVELNEIQTLHQLVRWVLLSAVNRWDALVAEVNAHGFAAQDQKDLPVPALRLAALELGIRYGAWAALMYLTNAQHLVPGEWTYVRALGRVIDECRGEQTLEELAHAVGVSQQALLDWRSGNSLPTGSNIEALAKSLTGDGDSRWRVEGRIRFVVASAAMLRDLGSVCGTDRINDILVAHTLTSAHVVRLTIGPLVSEPTTLDLDAHFEWRRARRAVVVRLWQLLMFGAACPTGMHVCEVLAKLSQCNQEVATDFLALRTDWIGRVQYWFEFLANKDDEMSFAISTLQHELQADGEVLHAAVAEALEQRLRMSGFDARPHADAPVLQLSPPPLGKAMNRVLQAQRADSVGDRSSAIKHMRAALRHQPDAASFHFMLGCFLSRHGNATGSEALMEEGLRECRIAVQLDPEFGNARNEIGIILSNLGRWHDAEQAYVDAEPYHGGHSHHWLARGINYLFLHKVESARRAFEQSIQLTKDTAHVEAKSLLVVCLMALGKRREGQRLGKRVMHITGVNPANQWRAVLRVRFGFPDH